jgi:hypothetical protein
MVHWPDHKHKHCIIVEGKHYPCLRYPNKWVWRRTGKPIGWFGRAYMRLLWRWL